MTGSFMEGVLSGELLGVQYHDQVAGVMFFIMSCELAAVVINIPKTNSNDEMISENWHLNIQDAEIGDDLISIPAVSERETVEVQIKTESEILFLDSSGGKIKRSITNIDGFDFDGLAKVVERNRISD